MSGSDVKRVGDLRRLFEEQLKKVDHKKDHDERMEEAASLMDKLVGRAWRGEAKVPGIEIIEVEVTGGKPADDPRSFYQRVHQAMKADGLDFNHDEPERNHEEAAKRQGSLQDKIMCAVKQALEKVFSD